MELNSYDEEISLFDWKFYLEQNEDLYSGGLKTKEDAISHWEKFGKKEGRKSKFINTKINKYINKFKYLIDKDLLNFSEAWELISHLVEKDEKTSDNIVNEIINTKFIKTYSGDDELINVIINNTCIFDWKYYIDNNNDLKKNGINSEEAAINHWKNFGIFENRPYKFLNNKVVDKDEQDKEDKKILIDKNKVNKRNFDYDYYLKNNSDLKSNNILTNEKIWHHWINFGIYEDRSFNINENIVDDDDDYDDDDNNYNIFKNNYKEKLNKSVDKHINGNTSIKNFNKSSTLELNNKKEHNKYIKKNIPVKKPIISVPKYVEKVEKEYEDFKDSEDDDEEDGEDDEDEIQKKDESEDDEEVQKKNEEVQKKDESEDDESEEEEEIKKKPIKNGINKDTKKKI